MLPFYKLNKNPLCFLVEYAYKQIANFYRYIQTRDLELVNIYL